MSDDEGPLELGPKQRRSIAQATARVNIWHGSVSSGKTVASIIAWLDYLNRDCPNRGEILMIGVTLQSLERNVLNVIAELDESLIEHTTGASTAKILGRTVATIGANDARAERRIRGVTAAGAYVDEASLLPNDGYWQQLLNRMRVPGARLFATTNPDNPTHWLKTVIDDPDTGYAVWHFTLPDNPGLTDEYVAAISRENTGLWYKRNILGLWVLAEGVIWDAWDEERHVVPRMPQLSNWTVAVDYGTAGVFAAQLLGIGPDERVYLAREYRWDARAQGRQRTDAQFSQDLRAWLDNVKLLGAPQAQRVYVDPSATSFIRQLHYDGWQGVRLADNDVLDGIRSVASLIAGDRFRVHESCTGWRGEVPGYVWDPKAAKHGEDSPVKANDHHCDATRYGVMGLHRWWKRWLTEPA